MTLPLVDVPDPGPSPWRVFLLGLVLGALLMHVLEPRSEVKVVRFRVLEGGRTDAKEAEGN
jgi:hypothetical protein